ncbi:hypothetical protein [Pseudodonghicola flavimaris]|uniref:Uncharacterized protein n=1 Tax=Pseudodonghicola flavimaris TaxID=3050036 RepID=A0ABT7EUV6_9RHOB|nr:hypothetical protein [Pseudodonghicola flavimaris]MDK3016135.1 hypothetical protein [Pseudodonghicola flavimaris]
MQSAIDCASDMTRLWWRVAVLVEDANYVVAMRLMGFSGIWSVPQGESHDMIQEKVPAFTEGIVAGTLTAWAGRWPDQVMLAAVEPISARARANRSRLARLGPRLLALEVLDIFETFEVTSESDPWNDLQSQNGATVS